MRPLTWAGVPMLGLVVLAVLAVVFFGALRVPLEWAVGQATGRRLTIAGDMSLGLDHGDLVVRATGVSFSNAKWGRHQPMLAARGVRMRIRPGPLLGGRLVIPDVRLERPVLYFERAADGRKNWVLRHRPRRSGRLEVGQVTFERGRIGYLSADKGTDFAVDFSRAGSTMALAAKGRFHGLALDLHGSGGTVFAIKDRDRRYPLSFRGRIGDTRVRAQGSVAGLDGLRRFDMAIELAGGSLDQLYPIFHIAFPATPPYVTSGRLVRKDHVWRYERFSGRFGSSDLGGSLTVDTGGARRQVKAEVASDVLNLGDLGPVVGEGARATRAGPRSILPGLPFHPGRWQSVDADVTYRARSLQRPRRLPLENFSTRLGLKDGVLTLDPLRFGVAGGRLTGKVQLDGRRPPIRAEAHLRLRGVELAKLVPSVDPAHTSLGDVGAAIDLSGRGNSVRQMLATASGTAGLVIDGGEISRLLMEEAAMDLWGIATTAIEGDSAVPVRCAVADFKVSRGIMRTKALIFDTQAVAVSGTGSVDLGRERLDLTLVPEPKDPSLASLRSPLLVRGTFSHPEISIDAGDVAQRGLGALLLGALNPLLAVVPLIDGGEGKNSHCARLVAEAKRMYGLGSLRQP